VSKTPAKSATPLNTAAKKPAPSASAAKTMVKATAKKVPSRPVAKAGPSAASKASAPAKPAAQAKAHSPTVKKPVAAATPKADPLSALSVDPSQVAASRFADRFAPPKPPARQFSDSSMDTLKPAAKADPKLASAWKSKAGRELTEAELLAMPEGEYMNDKQLDFFRARLTALKDDLLSNAGETTEHLREDTSIVPDPADRATIEEEHALELRTRDRERKLLKKISQSLARIESGDYGFCDETGEPIGLGRLLARPTATLSLEAQQRRELKQKMFGD
jgi:DnaK suppressor protein